MVKQAGQLSRRRLSKRLGVAVTSAGVLFLSFGLFAGHAGAWEGSCYDSAPSPGAWTELRVEMKDTDASLLVGLGQGFSDTKLSVLLSGAIAADTTKSLTNDNIGSIDFSANIPVEAVYVRAGVTADMMNLYSPAVTSGTGLHASDTKVAIEWLTFCYNPLTNPTTTSTTTSTTAPTTTAPTTTASTTTSTATSTTATTTTPTTAPPTTTAKEQQVVPESTAPTQVLGVQITRPAQVLAFSGGHEQRWATLGLLFVTAGIALMLVDRFALRSRERRA